MTNIQAIDLLKDLEQSLDDYCELNDEGKTAFRMAITALELFGISEQLPSAQPERGKGRWLNINESEKWQCSECSRIMWFSPRLGVKPSDYRFCPNCGADMREEQE